MIKIFKHTNLKIVYRTNNSNEENLKPKTQTTNKFMAIGVYKLSCSDCGKAYVGQTGRFSQKGKKNICVPSKITVTHPDVPNI